MGLISVGVCVVGFVTDMMVVVEGYGGGRCRFVRALFVGWNENGLVTSRGPGLHGRLERERENEQCIIHQNNDYIMLQSSFLIPM